MGISLVTQDAAHKGFCCTFPLYRPSRSLEQFRTQAFLRIESTAVQMCARKGGSYGNKILYKNLIFFDEIFVQNLAVEDFVTLVMGKKSC